MATRTDVLVLADLVSRKWIDTLLVPHGRGTSEHVQVIYTRGLDAEGLLEDIEARMVAPNTDHQLPVLLAVSDNGPQMISGTTREFMALHALATHYGRPGVPTDQALIESFIGHVKAQWSHLEPGRRARGRPDRVQHRQAPRRPGLCDAGRRTRRTRPSDPSGTP